MMRKTTRRDGLTLLELMVSMSIFSILGLFLFVLMRNSLALYRGARSSGELYDKFDQLMTQLGDDLACVYVGDSEGRGPKVEFLCTHDRTYVAPEGLDLDQAARLSHTHAPGDPRSFLLRLVRTYPGGELESTVSRFAGTLPGGTAYIDGVDDLAESRAQKIIAGKLPSQADSEETQLPFLRAPGNLMEVMYFLDTGPYDVPGTFTLYRATRSPIGGPGSFFADETPAKMTPEWIERHSTPVVSGVAFFGLACWSQRSAEWNIDRVLDGDGLKEGVGDDWSELWWDSSRGRVKQFGLWSGNESRSFWEDDVFPRRVRIVVTFVPEGSEVADANLLGDLQPNARRIRISNRELFADFDIGGPRHLRIADEWMRVESAEGNDLKVDRGARSTISGRHSGGAPVIVGETIERVVEIPAYRTHFGAPGEKK